MRKASTMRAHCLGAEAARVAASRQQSILQDLGVSDNLERKGRPVGIFPWIADLDPCELGRRLDEASTQQTSAPTFGVAYHTAIV